MGGWGHLPVQRGREHAVGVLQDGPALVMGGRDAILMILHGYVCGGIPQLVPEVPRKAAKICILGLRFRVSRKGQGRVSGGGVTLGLLAQHQVSPAACKAGLIDAMDGVDNATRWRLITLVSIFQCSCEESIRSPIMIIAPHMPAGVGSS